MPKLDALILPPRKPVLDRTVIAGLPLVERAALALHQAGVERIVVSAERVDGPRLVRRLAARNVPVELASNSAAAIRPDHAAIVVSSDAIFEPAAVTALVSKAAASPGQVTVVTGALAALLTYVPPALVDRARSFTSMTGALWAFYRQHLSTLVEVSPAYCQPVPIDGRVWHLEAEELRRRIGPDPFYSRPIRMLSRPVTQICLRMRIPPTAVMGLGLGFSLLAAVEIAQRVDLGMVTGMVLLLASIVLATAARDMERASSAVVPAEAGTATAQECH